MDERENKIKYSLYVLYTYDLFEEFEKIFRQYLEHNKTVGN